MYVMPWNYKILQLEQIPTLGLICDIVLMTSDSDMLEVGNGSMSTHETKLCLVQHFSISWAKVSRSQIQKLICNFEIKI